MSTLARPSQNAPIDYAVLWHALRDTMAARYHDALIMCATERDHPNIMRAQGMVTTFGTVMGDMDSAERAARGTLDDD